MVSFWSQVKHIISSFNLFKNESTNENIIRCQRLATRFFLFLFLILSIILLIYTWLSEQTITETIKYPNQAVIEHLQLFYPHTFNCPCNQIVIPYNKVIKDNITYHQICASQFITQEWFEQSYGANITYIWPLDIRSISSAFSQILRSFCSLSNTAVVNAQKSFDSQSMITTKALTSLQFNIQVQNLSEFIRKATSINFNLMLSLIRGIMSGNQLISGLGTNVIWQLYPTPIVHRMINTATVYGGIPNIGGGCLCSVASICTAPAGLFLAVNYTTHFRFSKEMYHGSTPAIMIPGWKGGCYPFDSLSLSTLECFYNSTCLSLVVSNNTLVRPLDTNKQKHPISATVLSLLDDLFINNWNSTVFYEKYIKECAPKICTYSYTHRKNFMEIVTVLFGLIGGLISGLKFLVEQIVLRLLIFIMKRKSRRRVIPCDTDPVHSIHQGRMSFKQRLVKMAKQIRTTIIAMNLFSKTIWIRKENIQRQVWASRIFVLCLILAFVIQTIFIGLDTRTNQIIIPSPNQTEYENLLISNLRSLQCPCTNIAIKYKEFTNINPIYHQICSSKFTDHNWYSKLKTGELTISHDFRWSASAQFQLLNLLCLTANRTIKAAFQRFQITPFITHYILEPKLFELRAHAILDNFIKTTSAEFVRTLRLIRSLTSSSQFITLAGTNAFGHVTTDFLAFYRQTTFESEFLLKPECYCARDLHCQKESNIYYYNVLTNEAMVLFNVPGFIMACFPLNSLLGSSLICLYNATCINRTLSFFTYMTIDRVVLDTNKSTRFDHQATFETIVNELFIEDWQTAQSYSAFYKECMPSYCTYSITSKNNFLFIITSLIALYGGLNEALNLILPHLVNIIARFINKFKTRQVRNISCERNISSYMVRIRRKVLEFNVFTSSRNDPTIAREQRIATRLYMFMIIISLVTLLLYKGLPQHILTAAAKQPSEEYFTHLHEVYGDSLQCSASRVSIDYNSITEIIYSTHQICNSDFVEKNFTDYLFYKIVLPLAQNDFRSHAISFFHLLGIFCSQTKEIVTDSLTDFSRTSLINTRVLSPREFHSQTGLILFELKQTLSINFMQSLKIFQDYVQGNQLITLSASNWKFVVRYKGMNDLVRSIPIVRSNCSCATSNLCFEPAKLYINENDSLTIRGIQIGCTPLDSVLSSTLECFYDQSCINDLIDIFKIPFNVTALKLNQTQLTLNTTVQTLLKYLFIEQWKSSANYSKYYTQVHPIQCFYSYINRNNLFNVIIEILGLYGGLNVALHFLVPIVVQLAFKIKRRFQN